MSAIYLNAVKLAETFLQGALLSRRENPSPLTLSFPKTSQLSAITHPSPQPLVQSDPGTVRLSGRVRGAAGPQGLVPAGLASTNATAAATANDMLTTANNSHFRVNDGRLEMGALLPDQSGSAAAGNTSAHAGRRAFHFPPKMSTRQVKEYEREERERLRRRGEVRGRS